MIVWRERWKSWVYSPWAHPLSNIATETCLAHRFDYRTRRIRVLNGQRSYRAQRSKMCRNLKDLTDNEINSRHPLNVGWTCYWENIEGCVDTITSRGRETRGNGWQGNTFNNKTERYLKSHFLCYSYFPIWITCVARPSDRPSPADGMRMLRFMAIVAQMISGWATFDILISESSQHGRGGSGGGKAVVGVDTGS